MKRFLIALLAVIASQASALADYSLTWSPVSGSAGVGSPLVVELYLNETNTTNINDFGVQNADISVTTSFGTLSVPVGNNLFDSVFPDLPSSTNATISEFSLFGAGVGNGNSIRLGTFTINSAVEGSGVLTVSGLNGTADDITVNTDGIGGVDQIGSGAFFAGSSSFAFSFTAVPEPTSLIAASGMGLVGAWVARRRKRKMTSSEMPVDEAKRNA